MKDVLLALFVCMVLYALGLFWLDTDRVSMAGFGGVMWIYGILFGFQLYKHENKKALDRN